MRNILIKAIFGLIIVILAVNYVNKVVGEISGEPQDNFLRQIINSYVKVEE